MKKILSVILVLAMLLSMAACGGETTDEPTPSADPAAPSSSTTPSTPSTPAAPTPTTPESTEGFGGRTFADEQVYNTLYSSEVATMNYLYSSTEIDMITGVNCSTTLLAVDNHGIQQPCAATSYEVSDDGLTYTFHIREGQYWYDCDGNEMAELTAEDFVTPIVWCSDAANDSGNSGSCEIIKNSKAYYDQTAAIIAGETPETNLTPEDIGAHATDKYTLVYELEYAAPYFPSLVEFGCYFAANKECLDTHGAEFGTDNTKMWYCGAYIMDEFEPQEIHHYVKNENFWDADRVYIEEINRQYNAEAATLQPTLFLQGEVCDTEVSSDLLSEWQGDPEKSKMITTSRISTSYSYFWGFDFEPRVTDTDHNDQVNEMWRIAVNNENFRKSIMYGMDRIRALQVSYPANAKELIRNTLVPKQYCSYDGKDYTEYGDLAAIADVDFFDPEKAKEYRDKAIEELRPQLQAAGYDFPIEIVTQYNGSADWGKECMVIKQQMEELLGSDYITWTILNFGSQGFLAGTRRCGNYCMQKLNGGGDYIDPETWYFLTDNENNYIFEYDTTEKYEINTKTPETLAITEEYYGMMDKAIAERSDMKNRFTLFANAEAFFLSHAMAIPYRATGGGYTATKLDPFEATNSACGWTYLSYRYQHVYEEAMSQEMYEAELAAWEAGEI